MATTRDTERLFVKPAPGRLVRHPVSMRPLRAEGEGVVGFRGYWHRMITAGDVVVIERPQRKTEETQ
jgi:hypothetical protein